MATHYHGRPEELDALNALIKLMRAADSVSAELARTLTDANLTPGQFGVLEALLHLGHMSQCDLGAKLLRSGSNVTMVVDNLERRGLVSRTRRTDDRRIVEVSLTAEGRTLIERLFPKHVQRVVQIFAALSIDQQRQLAELCRTLGRSVSTGVTSS